MSRAKQLELGISLLALHYDVAPQLSAAAREKLSDRDLLVGLFSARTEVGITVGRNDVLRAQHCALPLVLGRP